MLGSFRSFRRRFTFATMLSLVFVLASFPSPIPARAQLDACSASSYPLSVSPGSDNDLSFGIYSLGPAPITWLQIVAPAENLVTIEAGSGNGWQSDISGNTLTFTGGSLPNGSSQGFDIQALATNSVGGPDNWTVSASDSPDGSDPTVCDGSTPFSTQIQPSVINISNAQVSGIGASFATITWDTDVASTSEVDYGLGANYGSPAPADNNLVTSHSVTLIGLSQNSGYHYQVTSTTPADGGSSTSGDNTFVTAQYVAPVIVTQTQYAVGQVVNIPGAIILKTPIERTPPTVSLTTNFSKPFHTVPTITGVAADNTAVARIEYSIDGGSDWLPIDSVSITTKNAGGEPTSVAFAFTPVIQADGNYPVTVRAIDTSGNVSDTPPQTLVLDTLPPQIGEVVISFGPEVLAPGADGTTTLVAGTDYHFTTSSIGGATNVTLFATPHGPKLPAISFGLSQSRDTMLWSGILSVRTGGLYDLTASSTDGAGNHTLRSIGSFRALAEGTVVGKAGKTVDTAKVTLYYQEPSSNKWVVWDGTPYGEVNPQPATHGHYSLMAPAGTYYLQATAPGYQKMFTNSFTVTQPTSFTPSLMLSASPHLGIGRYKLTFPTLTLHASKVTFNKTSTPTGTNLRVGTTLPDFSLALLSGGTRHPVQLDGRPTVVTLMSLWSPTAADQLTALAALQRNPDVGVMPVFLQTDVAAATNYLQTGGYTLDGLADPNGVLINAVGVGAGPEHIFLDQSGHIRKIIAGVLSEAELTNELEGL